MTRTTWTMEQLGILQATLFSLQIGHHHRGLGGHWQVPAKELQCRQDLVDELNKVTGAEATMEHVMKKIENMRTRDLASEAFSKTPPLAMAAPSGDVSGIITSNYLEMRPADNFALDLMDGSFRGGAASDPNDTFTLSSNLMIESESTPKTSSFECGMNV